MDSLATELKNAREQKRMSLSDIADATLINVRFLEELERGNFSFLPQTYVRAFLREYASAVGLAPEAILQAYDAAGDISPATAPPAPSTPPPLAPAVSTPVPAPKPGRQINPTTALVALVVIGVLAVVVAVWNIMETDSPAAVREIPFDQIRAEHERSSASDSGAVAIVPPPAATRDTLVLTAVAMDSIWMQLTIDNAAVRNVYMKPGSKNSWRAANRFLLTLGNAGAVEFTLNKKPLGKLGKPGAVVKNVELSHATLARK